MDTGGIQLAEVLHHRSYSDDGGSDTSAAGSRSRSRSPQQQPQQQQHNNQSVGSSTFLFDNDRSATNGGTAASGADDEDDEPQFVLQYSTVDGKRQRKDSHIVKFIRRVVADTPLAHWIHPFRSPCLSVIVSRLLLTLLFVLPCVWSIVVACIPDDLVVPPQLPIDMCSFQQRIATVLVSDAEFATALNLKNASSSLPATSVCVTCNGQATTVSSSAVLSQSTSFYWHPIPLAIVSNVVFMLSCLVVFHRFELRRRLAAFFLGFGVILKNRDTVKRRIGLALFLGFFLGNVACTCAPEWSRRLQLLAAVSSSSSGNGVPLTTAVSARTAVQPLLQSDFLALLTGDSTAATRTATLLGAPSLECFAFVVEPNETELVPAATTTTMTAANSSSTSTLPTTAPASFLRNVSILTLSASFRSSAAVLDSIQAQQQPPSFLSVIRSILAAALPYVPVLLLIWSRVEGQFPFHWQLVDYAMQRGRNDIVAHLDARVVKWQCDLDVALKAIGLYARTTDRTGIDEYEGDEDEDDGEEENDVQHQQSQFARVNSKNSFFARCAADGFIVSWIFAMTFRAGWFKGSGLNGGRWTSKAHPHELGFGTTWVCGGGGEEEGNAVMSILYEHRCLKPVKRRLRQAGEKSDENDDDAYLEFELRPEEEQPRPATTTVAPPQPSVQPPRPPPPQRQQQPQPERERESLQVEHRHFHQVVRDDDDPDGFAL